MRIGIKRAGEGGKQIERKFEEMRQNNEQSSFSMCRIADKIACLWG